MAIGRVPGATGIQPSIVTAKGDLIVATANGSVTNQAVGTNNQVLMADSAQADGVKWANEATSTLTTTGDILYASAANTLARRAIGSTGDVLTVSGGLPTWAAPSASVPANSSATVATSQTTTSSSYTDLATSGPAVTVTTGTKALVIVSSRMRNDAEQICFMSYAVSGATTVAATDTNALLDEQYSDSIFNTNFRASSASVVTLTAGSNTFTAKYKVSGGTGTFLNREIIVINLA